MDKLFVSVSADSLAGFKYERFLALKERRVQWSPFSRRVPMQLLVTCNMIIDNIRKCVDCERPSLSNMGNNRAEIERLRLQTAVAALLTDLNLL